MAMSDANNLLPNYLGLITPVGVGLYRFGLGVLSVYPRASGQYWTYLGSNGPSVDWRARRVPAAVTPISLRVQNLALRRTHTGLHNDPEEGQCIN